MNILGRNITFSPFIRTGTQYTPDFLVAEPYMVCETPPRKLRISPLDIKNLVSTVFKGTVTRDFRPSVFFINQPHLWS
jgi:hypothetical protein